MPTNICTDRCCSTPEREPDDLVDEPRTQGCAFAVTWQRVLEGPLRTLAYEAGNREKGDQQKDYPPVWTAFAHLLFLGFVCFLADFFPNRDGRRDWRHRVRSRGCCERTHDISFLSTRIEAPLRRSDRLSDFLLACCG